MSALRFISVADEMAIEALPAETRRVLAVCLEEAFEAGYRSGYHDAHPSGCGVAPTDTYVRPARREWMREAAVPGLLRAGAP